MSRRNGQQAQPHPRQMSPTGEAPVICAEVMLFIREGSVREFKFTQVCYLFQPHATGMILFIQETQEARRRHVFDWKDIERIQITPSLVEKATTIPTAPARLVKP